MSEFPVYKIHKERHQEPVKRTLCLSETCLLERDPQTYSVCTLRPLCDVFALVRDNDNPQLFSIEYVNGHIRTYMATERYLRRNTCISLHEVLIAEMLYWRRFWIV